MEELSPPPCPTSDTVRRNPSRRARAAPSSSASASASVATTTTTSPLAPIISNFPIHDILSMDVPPKPSISHSLKVFLRLRPLPMVPASKTASKSLKSRESKTKIQQRICLNVNDSHSVTIFPPCESSRKSETYNGFSQVFTSDSSQGEVYENLMRPIVLEFLNGRSGLLAALGPSGSGKTHTVFGSAKDPGLVPLALRHIFEQEVGFGSDQSRSYYLSVFEIYSQKGKGEKMSDLSPEGGDICIQQSVVKGLKEVLVKDVTQAESLLAQAKLKRATAMTNSNSQSSRSQCIINIRCTGEESDPQSNGAVLTFVDLAGAEREKKTGNQGGRLLESNFINNTSMVFGLCLRSLLEYQKNPKKPMQKHFQSSLLTRYLRDYLEGRKRMALILTVRSGEEDYFDTSFLLRQASPYMEIKFHNMEETSKLPGKKRRYQTVCSGKQKRVKSSGTGTYKDQVETTIGDSKNICKETDLIEVVAGQEGGEAPGVTANKTPNSNCTDGKIEREYHVMRGFAKAMWNVLKQYKERVKTMQNEIDVLTENLRIGNDQYLVMEKELYNLKSQYTCHEEVISEGHGVTELECGEKGALDPAGAQCDSHPQREEVGEEEHMCSSSDCKESKFIQEQGVQNREVTETSASAVNCQWNDSERRLAGNPDSMEEDGFFRSSSVPFEAEELGTSRSIDVSTVHHRDFPTSTKILESLGDKNESDVMIAILRKPSLDATMSSLAETSPKESLQAQHLLTECEVSHHNLSGNDCYMKRTKNKDDKEPIGDTSCLPHRRDMNLTIQGERSACNTHDKEEKENAAVVPENNFSSEPIKQTPRSRPLNAKRPKRRLMPASSLLLRDVSGLDITDGSELRRGRGEQKTVEDDCQRSRGNASLFRLLKNHLPR